MKALQYIRRYTFGIPGIIFWALGAVLFYLAAGYEGVETYIKVPAGR